MDTTAFLQAVDRLVLKHPIVTSNPYTAWFSRGEASDADLRHFLVQFSVFSNEFLVAALRKVIHAPTPGQAAAGREILLNELGVAYGPDGSVEGSPFRGSSAHFRWLCDTASGVGLGFEGLGKRRHGTASTLSFCDTLTELYGSEDPATAEGAAFAVEHWAAAGFWQELLDGLERIKAARHPGMDLGFFTFHNRLEVKHAGHAREALEALLRTDLDREAVLRGAAEALEAVAVFWHGLDRDRRASGRLVSLAFGDGGC